MNILEISQFLEFKKQQENKELLELLNLKKQIEDNEKISNLLKIKELETLQNKKSNKTSNLDIEIEKTKELLRLKKELELKPAKTNKKTKDTIEEVVKQELEPKYDNYICNLEQLKEINNDDAISIASTNSSNSNKSKKKAISSTIKKLVWNINIGEAIGKAKCLCCNSTDITQMSFNCGHIIAEANGGETIVSNLKPICQNCNSSMGTKNMEDFMKTLK